MKNNKFKNAIITLTAIFVLTGCYEYDPICNINYIIENRTGHKFTMALKGYDNRSVDSIIILNRESYSFWESDMGGYPPPFTEKMVSGLNVYLDDVFIRSFDNSINSQPYQYNFLFGSAYPDETQVTHNTREAVRIMDEEFYKGLLESAKESNQEKK